MECKGELYKKKPVTLARQIDYAFNQCWGKVTLSAMHPIGQILSVIDRREFQNRTEYMHAPILVDAQKLIKMRAVR